MKTILAQLYTFLLLISIVISCQADIVRGKVLDTNNKPVAGADILMRFKPDAGNTWKYQQSKTDVHGSFAVDLPDKIDFSSEINRPIIYAAAPGKVYSVAKLQPENNVLHLDDAKIIRGHVMDQNNKPVANATIQLRNAGGKNRLFITDLSEEIPWANRFQTFTDKNGYWQMQVAPPGENINLAVSDPWFLPVDFTMIAEEKPLTIHVRPGAIITGRVLDENGRPLADVGVERSRHYKTKTSKDGIFRLTGLDAGRYHLNFDADKKPLVSSGVAVQITKAGETKNLPDIVMIPGGVVIGKVTNKQNGEPVANASVGSSDSENFGTQLGLISARTDANGNYELRLPPGKRDLFAMNRGQKYFEQFIQKSVTLKNGQTVMQNFEIESGETLSGIALDAQGKPLKEISVYVDTFKKEGDTDDFSPRKTITDENGNWSISGIAPRRVEVRVDSPWATDKAVTLALPYSGKLQLHLIPESTLPPIGKIITADGKPLAGIKATLQYTMPHASPFDIKTTADLVSDNNGYLHFRLPLVAQYPAFSDIGGSQFLWTSGGDWDEKTHKFSDAIIDPLTRQIHGRVSDAHGKPVPGARVLAVAQGRDETITNQKGEFAFANLPHQKMTLLAISSAGVARVILPDSSKSATLHLSPLHQNLPTRSQSLNMLEQLWRNSTEKIDTERSFLIDDMAEFDVPRALKMLGGNQENFTASQIPDVLNLIAKHNVKIALQWGESHLAQVVKNDRIGVLCELAKLAVGQNKTLSQKYFSQAVELAKQIPEPQKKIYQDKKSTDPQIATFLQSRIQLANAAAKVQPAQTQQWAEQVLQFTNADKDKFSDWPYLELVQMLAVNAPQESSRVIAKSGKNTKVIEYSDAVQAAAKAKNPRLALYWLHQFQQFSSGIDSSSFNNINPEFYLRQAEILAINAIGPGDPKQALQLAITNGGSAALILAGQYQSREKALEIWREADALGGSISDISSSRLKGLIYDADKSEGKVLFDGLVKSYWQHLNSNTPMRVSASDVAYPLARYKPRESWLMLQTEWAQSNYSQNSASSQANLALAMSAVDFTEAMNWARHINGTTSPDETLPNISYNAQRRLLQIALATPQQRRNVCLDCFDFSDSYKPGDPPMW